MVGTLSSFKAYFTTNIINPWFKRTCGFEESYDSAKTVKDQSILQIYNRSYFCR